MSLIVILFSSLFSAFIGCFIGLLIGLPLTRSRFNRGGWRQIFNDVEDLQPNTLNDLPPGKWIQKINQQPRSLRVLLIPTLTQNFGNLFLLYMKAHVPFHEKSTYLAYASGGWNNLKKIVSYQRISKLTHPWDSVFCKCLPENPRSTWPRGPLEMSRTGKDTNSQAVRLRWRASCPLGQKPLIRKGNSMLMCGFYPAWQSRGGSSLAARQLPDLDPLLRKRIGCCKTLIWWALWCKHFMDYMVHPETDLVGFNIETFNGPDGTGKTRLMNTLVLRRNNV